MPQETNLNVNPYFDDFNKDKNYYKVLFKPGTPVQARELSTLQSILQNQIEQFGTHFFKEGSKVIPGNVTYDNNFTCVQIESDFLGIPVETYVDQLVGTRITGSSSGVTASVRKILTAEDSERGNLTLYIKYEKSGEDFEQTEFSDGESLLTSTDITYGNAVIATNEPFANCLIAGSSAKGSAFSVGDGVYFIRGTFAQVQQETIVLEQYSASPSYRVGFDVEEDFITADEDPDLNDNASGFTNYAAPGADRFKIKISLKKKDLDDYNDQNFVEIARIEQGNLQTFVKETQYNLLADTLAKRTYDESGNYYVKPFGVYVKESLNDQIGSKGIYTSEQKTAQGNTPSEDLMTIQISPGKAYVKGYSLEKIAPTFIDAPKPRTTREVKEYAVSYSTGDPLFLNNVFGSPSLGIGTTAVVSLMSRRKSDNSAGTEIGQARLYDFKSQSSSYEDATTEYEIRLFDIKTLTDVQVSGAITSLSSSDYIQGKRSGATGYVYSGNGTNVTSFKMIDVSGTFLKDEKLIINGIEDGRIFKKVSTYTFNDVKSLKSAVGVSTFSADVVLDDGDKLTNVASSNLKLTYTGGNTGKITGSGDNFVGLITANNIISYSIPGETTPRFNRIDKINVTGNEIDIVGIPTVSGVCIGGIGTNTSIPVNDLLIRKTSFDIGDNSLLTPVAHSGIESLDVTNTTINIRKQYSDISIANSQFTTPTAGKDLYFQPFDEERYFLSYDDGSIEPLTSDQVTISDDKKTVTFVALSKATGKANLFATVLKSKIVNKQKKLNEANVLIVSRSKDVSSGVGTNTLDDGLTYSRVYGTRVQDNQISLNIPDACSLLGVFESENTSDPNLPSLVMTGFSGPSGDNSDLIVGENLTGKSSNSVALVVEISGTDSVGLIYLNENLFEMGETVVSEKSGISAVAAAFNAGDRDITDQFSLNINQKPNYYDFSTIIREKQYPDPERKLKIVFKNFYVDADDTGDFYNASSYPSGSRKLINVDRNYQLFVSDLIDIRPRVAAYDMTSGISPFDSRSRIFSTQGDGSLNPLVPDETLIVTYDYYLGRKDRIFIDKNGDFIYLQGIPSEDPQEPQAIGDAMEVAKLEFPAYLNDVSESNMIRTKHKRFTMADIGRLEKRIENVEYYSRLSLLELDTSTLQVTDANGLNRFKCGFFVDNFKRHENHQIAHPDWSAATDLKSGILRPGHYTIAMDLIIACKKYFGLGVPKKKVSLKKCNDVDGYNIKKVNRTVLLDFSETEMVKQIYASRIENVNPFLIAYFAGDMKLIPDSDTWVDTKTIDANVIWDTDEYDAAIKKYGIDEETGLSEVEWGSWKTDWVGEKVLDTYTETKDKTFKGGKIKPNQIPKGVKNKIKSIPNYKKVIELNGKWIAAGKGVIINAKLRTKQKYQDIKVTTKKSKKGIQYNITPTVTNEVIGEKVVSQDKISYMRRREIEFLAERMKPRTRFYPYFDGVYVHGWCTPKLLEIKMISGVFEVGETVEGKMNFKKYNASKFKGGSKDEIVFRVCQPNHKTGAYDNPDKVLTLNPYKPGATMPASYSSSSKLLNVDVEGLADHVEDDYFGCVRPGMKLVGETSGAIAKVVRKRLITDSLGYLNGCFQIPNPKFKSNPKFETGVKTFRLTTSKTNDTTAGVVKGHAEANFYAEGTLNTVQETVLSTKIPQIQKLTLKDQKVLNKRISRKIGPAEKEIRGIQYYDPLAQTFRVDDTSGVFITSVDVYMRDKDTEIPLTMQVRTVDTGSPTSEILPYSVVSVDPDDVKVSEDASVATNFKFDAPVYLEGEQEYALVLVTPSENYTAWISRMGEVDISTANLPDNEQVLISQQPYLGTLFKSQNGTTWDPSQLEDMKFTIYKAKFNTAPGMVRFFNSNISVANDLIQSLPNNSIELISRRAIVGIGTTLPLTSETDFSTGLKPGVRIKQAGNNEARANILAIAGIATINGSNDLDIINPGLGYTPASGTLTYSSVPMVTKSGNGSGAVGDVTVVDGKIGVVTFTNGGTNYVVGDTVGVSTLGLGNGSGDVISVGLVTATNSLLVDQVQGTFNIGVGTITYNNGSSFVALGGTNIGSACTVTSFTVDPFYDGQHFKVNHRVHAMHASNNYLSIKGVLPDSPVVEITADVSKTGLGDIQVSDSSSFRKFEGVGVGTTNYGYAMINGLEIVAYTGVADGRITGITTRGIGPRSHMIGGGNGQRTPKSSYEAGDTIQKYSLGGINLRRINCFHDMSDVDTTKYPKDLDSYYLKMDNSEDRGLNTVSPGNDRSGSGSFPARYFNRTKMTGGPRIRIQRNIQFESITPNIQTMTPPGTSVGGKIRTISATSINGSEESFVDQGYESIVVNDENTLDSPRMIAHRLNEHRKLNDVMPAGKSMVVDIELASDNENVSPMIDLDRVSMILTTNRLSGGDFDDDGFMQKTKVTGQDPSTATYISNMVILNNPATEIVLEFSGYRTEGSEIRAFYKTMTEGSVEDSFDRDFEPFPGFGNTDQFGKVKDPSKNSGQPDTLVPPSIGDEMKEYIFSTREIAPFTQFQIKVVLVGNDQSKPPKISELRGIAFA